MEYSNFATNANEEGGFPVGEIMASDSLESGDDAQPTSTSLNHQQTLIDRLLSKHHHIPLTLEEETKLAEAAHRGDKQALASLVEHNLRLVVYLAKRYLWAKGMDLADIVSEGHLGLLHAIDKYDGKLGYRFSTYAGWWIRQYIERGIMDKARLVRVPVYLLQERRKYTKTLSVLQSKLKREPTHQEIAECAGKDVAWVEEMSKADQGIELSLDNNAAGEDTTFIDSLADDRHKEPEQQVINQSMMNLVDTLLHTLPPIQQNILALRFGLMGQEIHTTEETAKLLGTSVSDVKRKQAAAIALLRSKLRTSGLEFND